MLISSHGTVLVTIGTKNGFVLAADSLQTRGKEILSDKKQKIYRVRKYVACSITGRTWSLESESKLEYDLHREITLYARNSTASSVQQHAEQMADWFYQRIEPFYTRFPDALNDWLERTTGRDSFISLDIVGYHDKKRPRWCRVNFPPRWEMQGSVSRLVRPDRPEVFPIESEQFGIAPSGWSVVVDSLRNKNEETYPDCRCLESIKKYHNSLSAGTLRNLALEEGIELARTFVECSIQYSPPEAGVGGKVQLAVVERKKGFRWVNRLSDDWT